MEQFTGIDLNDVVAKNLTMTVKIKGSKLLVNKLKIAILLFKLARWILRCKLNIITED